MSLYSRAAGWLRQKASGFWRRSLSLTDPDGWRGGGSESASGERVSAGSALALSAVWGCVNLLAGTIGSLPLMVYRTDRAGRRTVYREHPLYWLLHDSPNAEQTALDFWEFGCASLELSGNMLAAIERGTGGRVAALRPVRWEEVSVGRDNAGALRYRWADENRGSDGVLHVRGFGGGPEGGLSTLAYARHAFGLAQAIDRAAGGMFRNGLRTSGVLSLKDFMSEEKRSVYEEALTTRWSGAMNAGRPMILEGGATWSTVTLNAEDAQMLQSRGFSVEEICRFFGVPPFMVGHTEKTTSWGTGLEQQILGFQKFTLRRRLKRIEMALAKQLLTPTDRAEGVTIEFNLEGLLRGDSPGRAGFYQSGLMNGWMTINEVRALENMPPVEGGDVPRMQSQNVPITAVPAMLAGN